MPRSDRFQRLLANPSELGDADLPSDKVIDGRSFLPQLQGARGTPREAIFMHYDKDPARDPPKMRRVRFAFDGRYKLYHDGRIFDVPSDLEEERPLDVSAIASMKGETRHRLQRVLDSMPKWTPDNSAFGDGPDKVTKFRLQKLSQLRAAGE